MVTVHYGLWAKSMQLSPLKTKDVKTRIVVDDVIMVIRSHPGLCFIKMAPGQDWFNNMNCKRGEERDLRPKGRTYFKGTVSDSFEPRKPFKTFQK